MSSPQRGRADPSVEETRYADHEEARRFADLAAGSKPSRALMQANESPEAWAKRLWSRMDRDNSGFITRHELDCEEFHSIVRAAIAPVSGLSTGGAAYARTQINIEEAIRLCLRKADMNDDRLLSFDEFKSLLLCLKDPQSARHTANLVFSLFDLDGNRLLDKQEFHELQRFLLGRNPSRKEFEEEWHRIAAPAQVSATNLVELIDQRAYIAWMQASSNAAIQQQAPKVAPHMVAPRAESSTPQSPARAGTGSGRAGSSASKVDLSATGGFQSTTSSMRSRPKWNQKFNCSINPGHVNDHRPTGTREYFGRTQSMPELKRFWKAHQGNAFKKHVSDLEKEPPEPPRCAAFPKCLSTEGGTLNTMPERHSPAGTMTDFSFGGRTIWDDNWSTPLRFKQKFHASHRPLSPKATFGEITDCRNSDVSPAALREKEFQLDAKIRRRKKLAGPQKYCALEA